MRIKAIIIFLIISLSMVIPGCLEQKPKIEIKYQITVINPNSTTYSILIPDVVSNGFPGDRDDKVSLTKLPDYSILSGNLLESTTIMIDNMSYINISSASSEVKIKMDKTIDSNDYYNIYNDPPFLSSYIRNGSSKNDYISLYFYGFGDVEVIIDLKVSQDVKGLWISGDASCKNIINGYNQISINAISDGS